MPKEHRGKPNFCDYGKGNWCVVIFPPRVIDQAMKLLVTKSTVWAIEASRTIIISQFFYCTTSLLSRVFQSSVNILFSYSWKLKNRVKKSFAWTAVKEHIESPSFDLNHDNGDSLMFSPRCLRWCLPNSHDHPSSAFLVARFLCEWAQKAPFRHDWRWHLQSQARFTSLVCSE